MFIKLTIDGKPIWINTARIVMFGRRDNGAWVTINKGDDSSDMWVDESTEQIESVLRDVTCR